MPCLWPWGCRTPGQPQPLGVTAHLCHNEGQGNTRHPFGLCPVYLSAAKWTRKYTITRPCALAGGGGACDSRPSASMQFALLLLLPPCLYFRGSGCLRAVCRSWVRDHHHPMLLCNAKAREKPREAIMKNPVYVANTHQEMQVKDRGVTGLPLASLFQPCYYRL